MIKIIITTAENATESTYKYICDEFIKKYGDVEFDHIIDNDIIGGFIADVDGEIYDVSVASQLKKMQKQILG